MEGATNGYHGKVLYVDLTERVWREEKLPDEVYRQYYGGYGLGVYFIYRHLKPGADPLGPDNLLGFCPGLLTGTSAPFSGRYMVCGKSPLTGKSEISNGGWGNANSGGFFGPEIKKTGYDAIFFTGKAEIPVYLLIKGDEIQLLDAGELWGQDIVETEKIVRQQHGDKVQVSCIGRAGENLSLIAGIANDLGRIAARSGLGAVMGSKNLKAVCLEGNKKVEYFDRPAYLNHIKSYNSYFASITKKGFKTSVIARLGGLAPIMRMAGVGIASFDSPNSYEMLGQMFVASELGTTSANVLSSQIGDSPVKNFDGVGYRDFPMKMAKNLDGNKIKKMMKRTYGCHACPARCGAILEYDGLPYPEKTTHRPEYETCAAFGSTILNGDLDLLLKVNEKLNRAGMDSISAGIAVSFAIECCDRGLLKAEDLRCKAYPDGFLLKWNDNTYILTLLDMIIDREGFGDVLADGVAEASKKIPGSGPLAMHANGQEIPMHDPRSDIAYAVTYIADPTPGRHTAATLTMDGMNLKKYVKELGPFEVNDEIDLGIQQAKVAKFKQTLEANGLCMLSSNFGAFPYLQLMNSLTGWNLSLDEVLETGHRIQTLRQMFNAREKAILHYMPQRLLGSPPQKKGPLRNASFDPEAVAMDYYESLGFGQDGVPRQATLEKLDLKFAIPDLEMSQGVQEPLINRYLEKQGMKVVNFTGKLKPMGGG